MIDNRVLVGGLFVKRNMKQLSFLLFGLLLLLAACGSGSSSSSDAKGDEKIVQVRAVV